MITKISTSKESPLLWVHGKPILATITVLTIIGLMMPTFLLKTLLLVPTGAFLLFSIYFFRNPDRDCKAAHTDENLLVSPADGRVVEIINEALAEDQGHQVTRISIFLSPLDVHVNRIPLAGTVTNLQYKPGAFIVAFAPKSSEINERNDITITTKNGTKVLVRQIAGFVARRICWWVQKGQNVHTGERYGMIRFGSRVDLFIPTTAALFVKKGDYVYGGQTALGRIQ